MQQKDSSIPASLRLRPGQQNLTPAQEAEARCFAEERIQAQLSTESVDEQEAEAWLRQAYQVAGLAPLQHIRWLDSPLQCLMELFQDRDRVMASLWEPEKDGGQRIVEAHVWASLWERARTSMTESIGANVEASVRDMVQQSVWDRVGESVYNSLWQSVWPRVKEQVEAKEGYGRMKMLNGWGNRVRETVRAYDYAGRLAFYRFLDLYLAPNHLSALAQFNELVSGYWLGRDRALIIRRPRLLSRDDEGHLHSATGRAIEYHDGWGFYARHGVRVPAP